MGAEIIQPAGIEPPPTDCFDIDLAYRKIRRLWLSAVGPQLNLDVKKLIIGYLLTTIEDNGNMVFWINYGFNPKGGQTSQDKLLGRLNWEIETPELPAKIGTILRKEKAVIEKLDGENESEFRQILSTYSSAKRQVDILKRKDPRLREATDYYVGAEFGTLSAPWQSFIEQLQNPLPVGRRQP